MALAQIEQGDFYFEMHEYGMALEAYEHAYNEEHIQHPYLSRKLAMTYRMLGDMDSSREWYAKTLHRDKSNAIDLLYYAEALKCNKEYDKAAKWYREYKLLVPDDRRAVYHTENSDYVAQISQDSIYYVVYDLQMNTDNPEFGITRFDDRYLMSYVGVVNPEMGSKYLDVPDDQVLYLDVFEVEPQDGHELAVERWVQGGVNTRFHDGPVCYDPVHQELIITRTNTVGRSPVYDDQGKVNIKLVSSKYVDGAFQEAEELPINSREFSNAHPAISADGNTLYFASNRVGGHGGTDLYFCTRGEQGWSAPQNLGPAINTEGDEAFPTVDEEDNLYFSSTGHAGLGGYDIFKTKKVNERWRRPHNMGAPINSHKDDHGLLLDPGAESGYFSSTRNSETTDDDIFYFKYDKAISLRGRVTDDGDLSALDDALIRVYDMDGNLLFEDYTDVDGYYDFNLSPDKCNYRLEISKGDDYAKQELMIEHCDSRLKLYDMGETLIGELSYVAIGTVRMKETLEPIKDYRVTLFYADTGEEVRRLYTNEEGAVKFNLKADTDYKVTFQKEGWFAKSAEFSTKGMAPGTVQIDKFVDLLFEEIVVEKTIKIENIYWDFDKFNVRDDAKLEFDKVIKMMEDNPTIRIELSSHTDSRGNDRYNKALSGFRAKSAKEYMVSMGIDPKRIESQGYGESRLKNRCANGVNCTRSEHEENRRTEFKVLEH